VSCQPLIRIFSTSRSPGWRSSPGTRLGAPAALDEGAALLDSLKQRKRFSFSPFAPSSTTYQTWITGTARRATRVGEPAAVLDDVLLGRMLGRSRLGESASLADHVVLHVLDDQAARLRSMPMVSFTRPPGS